MVSTRLFGRLGNNLFQYAAAIGLSIRDNVPYCIPLNTANNNVWKPYRFPGVNYCDKELSGFIYKEPEHSYREIPKFDEDVTLEGYWQSEKYFSHCRPEIIKAFGFDDIETVNDVCSIHVRRGDYLLLPTKHPTVTPVYLTKAIMYMVEKGYRKFKVFSDDIPYCRNFFGNEILFGDLDFEFSEGKSEIEDLREMAACGSNIIANSSFSWWGAWLSPNPNKKIICPHEDNYFGPDNKNLDVSTLLPKDWMRIKY